MLNFKMLKICPISRKLSTVLVRPVHIFSIWGRFVLKTIQNGTVFFIFGLEYFKEMRYSLIIFVRHVDKEAFLTDEWAPSVRWRNECSVHIDWSDWLVICWSRPLRHTKCSEHLSKKCSFMFLFWPPVEVWALRRFADALSGSSGTLPHF